MESDMPVCKNHVDTQMVVKGTRMECPVCGYGHSIPRKMPTYNELLEKYEALQEKYDTLEKKHKALEKNHNTLFRICVDIADIDFVDPEPITDLREYIKEQIK